MILYLKVNPITKEEIFVYANATLTWRGSEASKIETYLLPSGGLVDKCNCILIKN